MEIVFIHIELDVLNLNMIKPEDVKLENIKVKKRHTKKNCLCSLFSKYIRIRSYNRGNKSRKIFNRFSNVICTVYILQIELSSHNHMNNELRYLQYHQDQFY